MAVQIANYPLYQSGSSAVPGKLFLLYVNYGENASETSPTWVLLGGLRDNPITIESDEIDASNKSSNGWGESLPGINTWSSSCELVIKQGDLGYDVLESWKFNQEFQAAKPALNFLFYNLQTSTAYVSWGIISSLEIAASYDDVMTATIDINGVAPIEKTENYQLP